MFAADPNSPGSAATLCSQSFCLPAVWWRADHIYGWGQIFFGWEGGVEVKWLLLIRPFGWHTRCCRLLNFGHIHCLRGTLVVLFLLRSTTVLPLDFVLVENIEENWTFCTCHCLHPPVCLLEFLSLDRVFFLFPASLQIQFCFQSLDSQWMFVLFFLKTRSLLLLFCRNLHVHVEDFGFKFNVRSPDKSLAD